MWGLVTTCVECGMADVPDLNSMIDDARQIEYATFRRKVTGLVLDGWARGMGYVCGPERGLHLKDDYHVGYYVSHWKGKLCLYIRHSAIEHIFTKGAA